LLVFLLEEYFLLNLDKQNRTHLCPVNDRQLNYKINIDFYSELQVSFFVNFTFLEQIHIDHRNTMKLLLILLHHQSMVFSF